MRVTRDVAWTLAVGLGTLVVLTGGRGEGSEGAKRPMTREEAQKVVLAFMKQTGVNGTGLNEKGFAGMMFGKAQIYFEYAEGENALHSRAHIYSFLSKGITPIQKEEVWKVGANDKVLGGGRLEYMPENKGLFLARTYGSVIEADAFVTHVRRLAEASLIWRDQLLLKALDNANQRKAPAR